MTDIVEPKRSWGESLRALMHPKAITMLFLGLSAGLPILLIFSSLSLWLSEAGLTKSAVTMFSFAALGYSFKFVWAPLIDRLPVPILTRLLGRRRAWILISQVMIIGAICWMAVTDPATGTGALTAMALAAVLLGFSSATQDIVIDAYRIECASKDLQAMLSATYIAGYRIGMVVAGAGALYIADWHGSTKEAYSYEAWRIAYLWMAGVMLVGVLTTLIIREPEASKRTDDDYPTSDYVGFVSLFVLSVLGFVLVRWLTSSNGWNISALASVQSPIGTMFSGWSNSLKEATGNGALASTLIGTLRIILGAIAAVIVARLCLTTNMTSRKMVSESYVDPIREFFRRYGMGLALLLLALVGLYRISDIVLGVISNVFYQDVGFTKTQIAGVSKGYGLGMTIAGGFLGGLLAVRFGVMKILFLGAALSMVTNLLFILLSKTGPEIYMLIAVISIDNLSAGLASAAFVAFLSSLTNVSFTAVQYAIFTSLMTLLPKIIGGYSGTIVEATDYTTFFLITTALGIPVLVLVWLAGRWLDIRDADAETS